MYSAFFKKFNFFCGLTEDCDDPLPNVFEYISYDEHVGQDMSKCNIFTVCPVTYVLVISNPFLHWHSKLTHLNYLLKILKV